LTSRTDVRYHTGMGSLTLERPAAPSTAEPSPAGLVADAAELLSLAGLVPVEALDSDALGRAITELARVESRAGALRLALSAETDRRRVADEHAETGTDAWLARLTGSTREQMAGGLRLAALLRDTYAATREAFAAGDLRLEQVRVIVNAAEQAPAEASRGMVSRPGDGSRYEVRAADRRQAPTPSRSADVRRDRPRPRRPARGDPARSRDAHGRVRDVPGVARQRRRHL
jgi:hypothetical protein